MTDIAIRVQGRAGRITLTRPQALNALTHAMCLDILAALDAWAQDPAVAVVVIDAEGERAFCAGGDIAAVYHAGIAGDPEPGRAFWRDEYRMNLALSRFAKPVVALMQGFVMGGGVGLGGHVRHRVVGETTQVAMPECGIGLIPDVGGTLILARAPGRSGLWAGLTAARLGPDDAIRMGFADHFVPQDRWPGLIAALAADGDPAPIAPLAETPPPGLLAAHAAAIDAAFAPGTVAGILARLAALPDDWAVQAARAMARNSPLSMACTAALLDAVAPGDGLAQALVREYRFTHRAPVRGLTDFLEGVRAQIIDKDRNPRWRHAAPDRVTADEVAALLAPLGPDELTLGKETT